MQTASLTDRAGDPSATIYSAEEPRTSQRSIERMEMLGR